MKRIICMAAAMLTVLSLSSTALAAGAPQILVLAGVGQADVQDASYYVNGVAVDDSGFAVVNGSTYASVANFMKAVLAQCEVSVSNGQVVINGTTKEGLSLRVSAKPGNCYLAANERYLYVPSTIRSIDGMTSAPLSVLAKVFNGNAFWDGSGMCHVNIGTGLLVSGSEYYDKTSVDLLSRLINSEAGNQSMEGRIAVANVILNRVENPLFPNNVYDVLYARNQFTAVSTRNFKKTPNTGSVIAAKLALEGVEVVGDAIYFNRTGLRCWASRNRPYVATVGNQDFYA